MSKDIFAADMARLLTPSLKCDAGMAALAAAVDVELKEIAEKQKNLYLIANIDNLPEHIVNLLAWQWHVDFWNDELPIQRKRELVKNSIVWHRIKGTPTAVEEIVTAAYGKCKVLEWFEYGGDPYYFKVQTGMFENQEKYNEMRKAIYATKNTRSWLDGFIIDIVDPWKKENQLLLHTGVALADLGMRKIGLATLDPKKYRDGVSLRLATAGAKSGTHRARLPKPKNKAGMTLHTAALAMQIGRKHIGLPKPCASKQNFGAAFLSARTGRIKINTN